MDWIGELEGLMKRRTTCKFDQVHVYSAQLDECPWCRIEDAGGPTFFVPTGGTGITADRLAVLDEKILLLRDVPFPELTQQQIELPVVPPLRKVAERAKFGSADVLAAILVVVWAAILVGAFLLPFLGLTALEKWAAVGGGLVVSLTFALGLIASKQARVHRKTVDDFNDWLSQAQDGLLQRGQAVSAQHEQRESAFQRATDDFKNAIEQYRTADTNLQNVLVQHREAQRSDFLRQFLIREYYRKIPGLSPSQVIMLESYGVESANDLERLRLYGIPSIDGEMVIELMDWRSTVERGFNFNPEHGISLAEVGVARETAVRRYKIAQARKILTASRQLETLAAGSRAELARMLSQFNQAADQWRGVASQLCDYQSGRRRFEMLINESSSRILALALGVPFVAFLLYLIAELVRR
jgi:DNA-binding helix-hairpin-helix protein with protein kinase domain